MKKKFTIFVVLLAGIIYTGYAQGVQWIYQQKQEKKYEKSEWDIFCGRLLLGNWTFPETNQRSKVNPDRICQWKHCQPNLPTGMYRKTNFAETVKVDYNPQEVSLKLLIDLFLKRLIPQAWTAREMTVEHNTALVSIIRTKQICLQSGAPSVNWPKNTLNLL